MNNANDIIKYDYITYNGAKYCIVEVNSQIIAAEVFKGQTNLMLKIADYDLWDAIRNGNDNPKDTYEEEIDNSIFYYCYSGFLASHPSLEEIKEYFSGVL